MFIKTAECWPRLWLKVVAFESAATIYPSIVAHIILYAGLYLALRCTFGKDQIHINDTRALHDFVHPSPRFLLSTKSSAEEPLASFSSGLDLPGLFDRSSAERFVSMETPKMIIEKVGEMVKAEDKWMRVRRMKKELGIQLEEKNGNFSVNVEVYRLSDNLVMVDVKEKGRAEDEGGLWRNKVKPQLRNLLLNKQQEDDQALVATPSGQP